LDLGGGVDAVEEAFAVGVEGAGDAGELNDVDADTVDHRQLLQYTR